MVDGIVELRHLAKRQHGHFSMDQALDLGVTPKAIARRIATQGWEKVLPKVFRLPGSPTDSRSRLISIQLWMGEEGHFTGPSAAYLHGLHGFTKPLPVTVARRSGTVPPGVRLRRLRDGESPRTRSLKGFRVASVERTLLDLASSERPRVVGEAVDDALRKGLTNLDRLKRELDAASANTKGSRTFRTILRGRDADDAAVRTMFETKMLRIIQRIGVEFTSDYRVEPEGNIFYLDFYIPSAALGVECHSMSWHGPERHNADAKRGRLIAALGIEILYFTWDDVVLSPKDVEAELRAATERRQLRLLTV